MGWKAQRGYDKPLFINDRDDSEGLLTDTIFFDKSVRLFALEFGKSDEGRDIGDDIQQRMWPSLAVALPTFLVGLLVNITLALFIVMFRTSVFDTAAMVACVVLMSNTLVRNITMNIARVMFTSNPC